MPTSLPLQLVFAAFALVAGSFADDQRDCRNALDECEYWAEKHECVANPFYMRAHCRKACGACGTFQISHIHPTYNGYRMSGFATEEGTRRFATMIPSVSKHVSEAHFRKDTSMGRFLVPGQKVRSTPWLLLSSFGTGTYLGEPDEQTDESVTAAVLKSVYHGLNVIDTASTYRYGRAEVAVGRAIQALEEGLPGFARGMLFISTKAGFLDFKMLQPLLDAGKIRSADVQGGAHCIATACLHASLEQSLTSLGLKTVDLLYLHNVAESLPDVGSTRFWEKLETAFKWLEEARARGAIRAYGLATWTCFRVSSSKPGFLSLQKVVQLAEQVGGKDHGFRYIQLPVNAGMMEAALDDWQPLQLGSKTRHVTLLQAAAELGVGVFASAPLGEGRITNDAAIQKWLSNTGSLSSLPTTETKLLQLARSTPLLLSAVVGHKQKQHVESNLALVRVRPMSKESFSRAVAELRH